MIDRLHTIINRVANVRSGTALLMLTFALMVCVNLINLPLSIPHIRQLSGGSGILDTELFYTAPRAYQVLDALQPGGRQGYLRFLAAFDTVFPLIYAAAMAVLLTVTFRSAFPAGNWAHKLNLVPLGAGVFDELENIAITTMLEKYPSHLEGVATVAGYFTLAKWVLSGLSLLLFLAGLLGVLWRRVRSR